MQAICLSNDVTCFTAPDCGFATSAEYSLKCIGKNNTVYLCKPPATPPAPAGAGPTAPPPPPVAPPPVPASCDRECQIKQKIDEYCGEIPDKAVADSCKKYIGTPTCSAYGDNIDSCIRDVKVEFVAIREDEKNKPKNIYEQLNKSNPGLYETYVGAYCNEVLGNFLKDKEGKVNEDVGASCVQKVQQKGCQRLPLAQDPSDPTQLIS